MGPQTKHSRARRLNIHGPANSVAHSWSNKLAHFGLASYHIRGRLQTSTFSGPQTGTFLGPQTIAQSWTPQKTSTFFGPQAELTGTMLGPQTNTFLGPQEDTFRDWAHKKTLSGLGPAKRHFPCLGQQKDTFRAWASKKTLSALGPAKRHFPGLDQQTSTFLGPSLKYSTTASKLKDAVGLRTAGTLTSIISPCGPVIITPTIPCLRTKKLIFRPRDRLE